MINKPPIDELLKKVSNRFELVEIIGKRTRQLADGAEEKTKIKDKETSKVTRAIIEFDQDKIFKV